MNGKLTILVCILVAGVIVGASLPIFDSMTASSESIHNEGAGWVRFDLNRSADASYNINVSWDEAGYYIANGANVQTFDDTTVTNFETIIYADSNVSVWTYDGDSIYMLGTDAGAPVMATFTDPVSIARDSAGVVVSDGTDSYTFGAPAWAYVPQSSGVYGFFTNGTPISTHDEPRAVVGSYAGVGAYNDLIAYEGLPLALSLDINDNILTGAEWLKPVNPSDFDPEIIPLDPGIINPWQPGIIPGPFVPIDEPEPDPSEVVDTMGVLVLDDFGNWITPEAVIMSVPTPSYTSGDWGYDLSGDNATIVSYSGSGGNIVIPATIDGHPVTQIGKGSTNQVIDNASISANSTLTISNGPIAIKGASFNNCTNLTGPLVIPDSVITIGSDYSGMLSEGAFAGCTGFTSLTLGSGLTGLGHYTFSGCSGFTGSLVIPNSITKLCAGVFANCTGFTGSLVIPDSVDFENNGNASGAFAGCTGFTSLTLGSGVTTIGDYTFSGCSGFTGALVIPDSVTTIYNGAFRNCTGFTGALVIPDSVTTLFSEAPNRASGAFEGCTGFTSLTLGSGFTNIPFGFCKGCTGLTGALVIPDSVTSIGAPHTSTVAKGAFEGCTGFTSLTLGSGLTGIYADAFKGCTGFTEALVIPDSVTILEESLTYSGHGVFYGCSGFTSLTLGSGLTTLQGSTFGNCTGFTGALVIPDSVTSIGNGAFSRCAGFTGSLVIPDSVTSIGNSAFANCTGFTGALVIPDSVTSIGTSAFYDVRNVKGVAIGSEATPSNNVFDRGYNTVSELTEILDLSDTVDYDANRYGLSSSAVVSSTIDALGYIGVADLEGGGNGTIGDLIALLPVIMMAGIVLFAVVALMINRS